MKYSFARYLIKKTEDDYNKISSLFSNKRSYTTPDLKELEVYTEKGDRVLDFGCGNGRFFEVLKERNVKYLGVDASENLIEIAKNKYSGHKNLFKKISSTSGTNQFIDESFDVVFCLAVLHHIPGRAMREKLISEFTRMLKPGGRLIITVWDLRAKPELRKVLFWNYLKRIFGQNRMDGGDLFYPFKDADGCVLADRYLHAFTAKELKGLITGCGLIIESIGENSRGRKIINKNILVVAKKK